MFEATDRDDHLAPDGRVMEVLSKSAPLSGGLTGLLLETSCQVPCRDLRSRRGDGNANQFEIRAMSAS